MKRPLAKRFRDAVSAFYEGARYRIGSARINSTYQSARLDLQSATRQTLQAKARYFDRNSPLASSIADVFEAYTVGSGLQVHPQSSNRDWNRRARQWWGTTERFLDISSRFPFAIQLGLIARAWFVDGESFVILAEEKDTKRGRIQIIEADRVKTPPSRAKDEGISVVDGVEIDPKTGRPTAYWVATVEEVGKESYKDYPASNVVHVYEPNRSGQYRGVPFLTPAINILADLHEIEAMEIKAARVASTLVNVWKTETGEVDPVDVLASGGAISESSSGAVTAYKESLGGENIVLKTNESLEQWKSDRPTVVLLDYLKRLRADVCAAAGIPSVIVAAEQMQGTQYRGAIDYASIYFDCRCSVLKELVRRIWEHVIPKGAGDPLIAAAPPDWYRIEIPSPRGVNVDVGRNSSAMLAQLAAGATDYSEIYGPTGRHWEDAFEALAEQRRRAIELGIIAAPATTQPTP